MDHGLAGDQQVKRTPLRRGTKPLIRSKGLRPGKGFKARQEPLKSTRQPKNSPVRRRKAFWWERQHLKAVKARSCRACGRSGPSDAHHCYHDRSTRYGGRKAPHTETIPLCKLCHQDGPDAIHNIKDTWRQRHGPDWSYVPEVKFEIYNADLNPAQIKAYWMIKRDGPGVIFSSGYPTRR